MIRAPVIRVPPRRTYAATTTATVTNSYQDTTRSSPAAITCGPIRSVGTRKPTPVLMAFLFNASLGVDSFVFGSVSSSGGEQPEHRLGQCEVGPNSFEPSDQSCTH